MENVDWMMIYSGTMNILNPEMNVDPRNGSES